MTEHLTPAIVLVILFLYFAMLVGVAWFTGRDVGNSGFFLANRKVTAQWRSADKGWLTQKCLNVATLPG